MILDIIIIAVFVASAFLGYKKGFVKILTKIAGFILAVVLAYMFNDNLSQYLYKEVGFAANIKNSIQEKVTEYTKDSNTSDIKVAEGNVEMPKFISKIINVMDVDTQNKNSINLSEKITTFIFKGISFIIIFILVTTAIWILGIFLDGVFSLPVLKSFNELGGAIASVILTLLKVWIVLGIVGFLSPLEVMNSITKIISSSYITNLLYNNNIFINLILKKII